MEAEKERMPDPLPISVVVPAYNAAPYLAEALEGVFAQQRAAAETIVVDDGSSDASGAIARAYDVRVVTQTNRGLSAARNAGIAAATQPWVAFLDADDRWHPERLAAQWRVQQRHPEIGILACDYTTFTDTAILQRDVLAHTARYMALPRAAVGENAVRVSRAALASALVWGNFVLPSSWLVARRLFEDEGVLFAVREQLPSGPDFHVGEDYEWLLRALRHSDVAFVERSLVEYRRSAAALSADGARLRLGDVMLGDYVRRAPQRYAAGVAADFARVRPFHVRDVGRRYLAVGNVVAAHAAFARGAEERDPSAAALALLTVPFVSGVGRGVFVLVWQAWRRLVRPLLRGVLRLRRARGRA